MSTFKNYIDGNWVAGQSLIANINPSNTDEIIGEYAQADKAQTLDAIAAAEAAIARGVPGIQHRFNVLDAIGSEILARKSELGELLAREEGKTLPEAMGEVGRAGQIFKFFAGEALRVGGEFVESVRPGVEIDVRREPIGVIGVITPWNFPIAIPAWKIAPALAYGNAVVFKPAELTPGCAWALADIVSRSELPQGYFNLVTGPGSIVGQTILDDARVSAVSFTGSTQTGARVAQACATRGAKFQLEMGGKNPLVVLADADMKTAVECAANGAFFSTGQRCTASSRLIVEDRIHDEFVENLIDRMKQLHVDNALFENTLIGPVVDERQIVQNDEYLQIGQNEGAKLIQGGERVERATPGHYMTPALFIDTKNEFRINQEEIFGPVASVIKVSDFEEALSVANDTRFGLSAGICTQSLKSSLRFKNESKAGMVMVNLPTAGIDYHVPFGGTKESSYGAREQGHYASEFYTSVKTSYVEA